jgi:DNA processing protein
VKGDTKYWLGFNHVKGIGPVRLERILEYFGDIESAWLAREHQLRASGLNAKLSRQLVELRGKLCLEEVLEQHLSSGIQVLTWDDPEYPQQLRWIPQSPFVLYIKGSLAAEDIWGVAIVGTRRYSPYGRQVAEDLSCLLAQNGITVISGLARGIDGIAHQAALAGGGRTIGVLGSGLDQVYPPEHRSLAERMVEQGALVSDYPIGTPPDGCNFPPRNRIISGLSKVVVIVEAGEKSGALITATYAAEQGKEVLALPGKITAPTSKGTNLLIKQGAQPLLDTRDVLDMLNLDLIMEQSTARRILPGNSREALLYQQMGDEPLHVDEICTRVKMPIEEVTAALALMELKGLVRKVFGMKYIISG